MKIWNKCQWSFCVLILGMLLLTFTIHGQNDREILADLVREEQEAVNAIVLYPEDTRIAILNASLYPEALIKMESIQSRTRASFIELVEEYPQEVQEEIWDLARYPNLIHTLVVTPESEMEDALKAYPEVIHKRSMKAITSHYELLKEIDELNFMAESTYNSILLEYPEVVQNALNHLLGQPEVLTILMDNIRLTILVGKVYEKDPEWLLHKADSLHLELAADNARELEEWKQNLEDDPESIAQLEEVSKEYIEENNYYDDEYYDNEYYDDEFYDDAYSDFGNRNNNVTVNYYYDYNYPYWFGYPSWYTYPRWRMYPYWYDWGFYYGPNNRIIVLGLPSFHFTYWYFGVPRHHHHYNHLSTHFANHYYGHRNSTGSVTASVNKWRNNNRDIVSDRWIKDDGKLKDRFKEFGRAEVKRTEFNRKNPGKELSQREFIARNKSKYPNLSKSVDQVKTERKDIRTARKSIQPPKTQTKYPRTTQRPVKKNADSTIPKTTDPRKSNVPIRKTTKNKENRIPNTRKAKDFHKSTWEKTTTKRTKVQRPKTQVRKKPTVKKPTAKKTTQKKSKGN